MSKMLLGEKVGISNSYDPSVLFRVERKENREQYGLEEGKLPFKGLDVWNCYEVSFLLPNGLPVNGVLKIIYSAESKYIVESKSLKLYLNSFNMEKLDSINHLKDCVKFDLERLLEVVINLEFFPCRNSGWFYREQNPILFEDLVGKCEGRINEEFQEFKENPLLLQGVNYGNPTTTSFVKTDLLRSNCKVTNQPDWGDLFIIIGTQYHIDWSSVLRYIISFRGENHFHEEVVEMIFKRLWDKYEPTELIVCAKYTRRGGIDINPIRWSSWRTQKEIQSIFLGGVEQLSDKELRQ